MYVPQPETHPLIRLVQFYQSAAQKPLGPLKFLEKLKADEIHSLHQTLSGAAPPLHECIKWNLRAYEMKEVADPKMAELVRLSVPEVLSKWLEKGEPESVKNAALLIERFDDLHDDALVGQISDSQMIKFAADLYQYSPEQLNGVYRKLSAEQIPAFRLGLEKMIGWRAQSYGANPVAPEKFASLPFRDFYENMLDELGQEQKWSYIDNRAGAPRLKITFDGSVKKIETLQNLPVTIEINTVRTPSLQVALIALKYAQDQETGKETAARLNHIFAYLATPQNATDKHERSVPDFAQHLARQNLNEISANTAILSH